MKRSIEYRTLFDDPFARTKERRAQTLTISEKIDLMRRDYEEQYIWATRKAGL
jgi:hypothetical protein